MLGRFSITPGNYYNPRPGYANGVAKAAEAAILLFERRSPGLCDRFFGGGIRKWKQENRRFYLSWELSDYMIKPKSPSAKILPFAAPQAAIEGKLEKWFRGVVQSNRDLMTALERLSGQYEKLAVKPLSEADQAVLLGVQITLNEARKAQTF